MATPPSILTGKIPGQRSLAGCSSGGGLKESDTTKLACIQASGSTCPFTIYPGDWWGHSLLTRLKLKQ